MVNMAWHFVCILNMPLCIHAATIREMTFISAFSHFHFHYTRTSVLVSEFHFSACQVFELIIFLDEFKATAFQ
jgi:hypothetical protein